MGGLSSQMDKSPFFYIFRRCKTHIYFKNFIIKAIFAKKIELWKKNFLRTKVPT